MLNSFLNKSIEIRPSYGRKYSKQKDLKKDWNDGKDFNYNGTQLTIRDLDMMIKEGYENIYCKSGFKNIYVVRFGIIQNWVAQEK